MLVTQLMAMALLAQTDIIWVNGQSLALGDKSTGAISVTQTRGNKMHTGLRWDATSNMAVVPFGAWPAVDLVEGGDSLESPRSAIANAYYDYSGRPAYVVSSAKGNTAYVGIAPGTLPFMFGASAVEGVGARVPGSRVVAASIIHGESDHFLGTTRATYASNLLALQVAIDDKGRKSTGAGRSIAAVPLFVDQFSAWTSSAIGSGTVCAVCMGQYDAARNNPSSIFLVGPKYTLAYFTDGLHLTGPGYRTLGAYIGRAIAAGTAWQPFWPARTGSMARTGAVITATFYVPVPPIVIDTTTVTGVSASTRGFEYTDSAGAGTISSVDCSAACVGNLCTCAITLSADPSGHTAKLLRYAYTGTPGNSGGPTTGPRGNLRDSSADLGFASEHLYNWLVHFEESVP